MIHLDTSFLIRALVPNSAEDRRLRGWLREGTAVGISAIGWTEFLCGPVADDLIEVAGRIVGNQAPFSSEDAPVSARLYNASGRRRGSLVDCMIAAVALRQDAALATSNPEDFQRLRSSGLSLLTA